MAAAAAAAVAVAVPVEVAVPVAASGAVSAAARTAHAGAQVRATPAALRRPGSSVLVGVNYTNDAFPNCSFDGTGILRTLGSPGTASLVTSQLLAMRRAGARSLRLLVWFAADPGGQSWGVVPSAPGPGRSFRANLARFVRDVRAAGFVRLTVAFGPRAANSPFQSEFDPALLGEDWQFIAAVRTIVTRDGPPGARFDLLNEGAPSRYLKPAIRSQVDEYLVWMYRRYVQRFGSADVTVSAVGASAPVDQGDRLENLVALLRGAGLPLPTFFDVHANFAPAGVANAVADAERQLAAVGLRTPLVVGETAYDDPGVAQVLREALARDPGSIEEVDEWYQRPGRSCPVDPPYSVGAYRRALEGVSGMGVGHARHRVRRSSAAQRAPGPAPAGARSANEQSSMPRATTASRTDGSHRTRRSAARSSRYMESRSASPSSPG